MILKSIISITPVHWAQFWRRPRASIDDSNGHNESGRCGFVKWTLPLFLLILKRLQKGTWEDTLTFFLGIVTYWLVSGGYQSWCSSLNPVWDITQPVLSTCSRSYYNYQRWCFILVRAALDSPPLSLRGFPHNYQLQVQDDHLIARGEPNRYVFQGCVWYRFNEALGCTRTRGRRSTDSSTPDPALPPQLPWSPFPLSLAAPPSSPCRSPSPHPLSQLPTPGSSMMAARRTSSNVGWHHCARKDSFLSIWWRFEKFVYTSKMQRRTRCSLSQHRS